MIREIYAQQHEGNYGEVSAENPDSAMEKKTTQNEISRQGKE